MCVCVWGGGQPRQARVVTVVMLDHHISLQLRASQKHYLQLLCNNTSLFLLDKTSLNIFYIFNSFIIIVLSSPP